MGESEFRRLLRLGRGRAILYARDHDVSQFRDLILHACLHCYAIDPVCEGTRAAYMLDLLDWMPDKSFYCNEVLKSLPGSGDNWDAAQRFHFAACLAGDGSDVAKQVMYESFEPGPKFGEHIGCEFVELDKLSGLLFVAEKIGGLLLANPSEVDMGLLLFRSREVCGEQQTWDVLCQAGSDNPRIEIYRWVAEAREAQSKSTPAKTERVRASTYEQLKANLTEVKAYWISAWGEKASDEELALAAQGLMAADNPKQQLAHLRVFACRRFPLDPGILFALAEAKQEQLGLAAVRALSNVTHPAVRKLAVRLVDIRSEFRGDVIDLLAQNYQPGDHELALEWFETEEDPEILHSFASDLMHFWERHPDKETEIRMLHALYEKGPCSYFREFVVRRLLDQSALTEEMRSECIYDANYDVRNLVSS